MVQEEAFSNEKKSHQSAEQDSSTLINAVQRPDEGGKKGKQINVIANLFLVQFDKDLHVTHYDVTIQPMIKDENTSILRPATPKKIGHTPNGRFDRHSKKFDWFDGFSNAVTSRDLPFNGRVIDVKIDVHHRNHLYRLIFKRTGQDSADVINRYIKAGPQTIDANGHSFADRVTRINQSFNILIRKDALEQYPVHGSAGRRFFDQSSRVEIANGVEVWKGFFQSVLPLRGGLFVNLDVAFSPFLMQGPFMEIASKVLGNNGGSRRYNNGNRGGYGGSGNGANRFFNRGTPDALGLQKLRKALRNSMIAFTHRPNGKPSKFVDIRGDSADRTMFNREGREVSVSQYIFQRYNIRLQHPEWPCVIVGNVHRSFVPPELCLVIGNTPIPPQRMMPNQVQEMIKISSKRPEERLVDTMQWREKRDYEHNPNLQSWNFKVSKAPVELKARILSPPQLRYREQMRDQPQFGSGKWNLRSVRFFSPGVTLVTPVILNFTREDDRRCLDFVHKLFSKCAQLGMHIDVGHFECFPVGHGENVLESIKEATMKVFDNCQGQMQPQMLICFLEPTPSEQYEYEQIKRVAATELPKGLPSQCLNVRKAFYQQGQEQYAASVAMKINIKLGGCNHILSNPQDVPKVAEETMLIGLDIRHPPTGVNRDSIVAAVATLNGQGTRWSNRITTQHNPSFGHQQETILEGKPLFAGLLDLWKEENDGQLPQNIIVFRDGASQGEFVHVKQFEVAQLKQACTEARFGKAYQPNIVYIVATKKHRIRFFAQNKRDVDKSGNLPAGTVVDNTVTHPYVFEFYLQSHAGLIGTCRPAKYTVLHDEMKYSSDELQVLINSLCYSFQRATRSVSQVPFAKYAHALAEKANLIIYPSFQDASDGTNSVGTCGEEKPRNPP